MDAEVIVIGAGPTGLMLAQELALAGVPVTVVEKQAAPSGQSRGGGTNPRTSELLAMRGLIDAAVERSVPRDAVGGHFAGLPVPLDARPWRTRHPDGLLIRQDRLEGIIEERLRELGTVVRRRSTLTGVAQDDTGVAVEIDGPAGRESLRAQYLVACDGGHSAVRKLIGAEFPGRSGTTSAVSADIELAAASGSVPRTTGHISALIRTGGGYWMMMNPVGGGDGLPDGYRVVFGGARQQSLPREAPVTEDEVAHALTAVHGDGTVLGTLRWGTRFSDAARQVTAYRHGRVLFAGDAAHIHLPIGGQGLNLGVQDAVNLGWKLAATVLGHAPDGLLDSYHTERHPVGARILEITRAQGVIMRPPPEADDVLALREIVIDMARLPDANRYLAGLMSGLALRYDLGDPDPLVGTRMIDLAVRTDAGTGTVSSLMLSGRGLLLDLRLRDLGPPVEVAPGVDRVVARVGDSPLGAELDTVAPVHQVLIRPDGYLCWVGRETEASPEPALRRWFGPVAAR